MTCRVRLIGMFGILAALPKVQMGVITRVGKEVGMIQYQNLQLQ